MGADFIQHAIVTLAAIAAAWVVVRRLFTVVKPLGGGAPKCASCPAAAPQRAGVRVEDPAAQAHKPAQPVSSEAKPLTLIR
jgi:hypothetical protein